MPPLRGACLADYHAQTKVTVVKLLLTDGAKQYTHITEEHGRCWVHEGRLYKKLSPRIELFQKEQTQVLDAFWYTYRQLRAYAEHPTPEETPRLTQPFEALVSQTVSYEDLGRRLFATAEHQNELLVVRRHPEVPLHNNAAELGARQRVRKRDASLPPRTVEGLAAWDTMPSLLATTKQRGVNFYHFVRDRLTGEGKIPRLAELIWRKAKELNLGASWASPVPEG